MKKIYQQLTLLLFVLGTITIQAQFLNPDKPTNQNEFLIGGGNAIIAGPGDGCRNCSSEIRDFNFAFSNSFNFALANELLIQQAARDRAHDWYEEQKEVIRKHLNNFFDHSGNYEQAKNRLFAESEKRAINDYRPNIQNKYNTLNSRIRGKTTDLKGLRSLKQRELEIRNGNVSNSLYADVKVNGIPLKNINNLSTITRERNKILLTNNLDKKLWESHQYNFLAKSMDRNNPFQEKLLWETGKIKNQYYDSYDYWDRLNYIQLLVHTEQILRARGVTGLAFSEQERQIFDKFYDKTIVATREYIENLLQQEYLDNMYVMHPDYWKVLLDKYFGGLLLNQNAAKNLHRKLIKEERDRLVKNTPIGANSSVDYLVNELGITNKHEFNWLNANPNRATFYKTIIEDQKENVGTGEHGNTQDGDIIIVGGTGGPFGNAIELASTEIKNGGLVQAMIEELGITDNSQKRYLYDFSKEANRLRELADQNRVNNTIPLEIQDYIKGQAELGGIEKEITIKLTPRTGKLNNRDDQEYTKFGSNGVYNMYRMKDGSTILESPNLLTLDKNGHFNAFHTSEPSDYKYHYIKLAGEEEWSRYLLKHPSNTVDELEMLFILGAKEGAIFAGRYVLPIEDIKVVITGKDFNGENVSRWKSGVMLITDVAGGKIFKAVGGIIKFGTKQWRIIVKEGNRYYTKIIRAMSEATVRLYHRYGGETIVKHIDEALRKGELTGDIVEEGGEVLKDISEKKGRKLNWEEVKALFKRGNDFNKKAVQNRWYPFHEIVLANGKRLDSYNKLLGEIVSRKATTLNNIKFATFEKYLKELTTKYKVGTRINSKKYLDAFGTNSRLRGTYYLEIPDINRSFPDIQRYIDYAWNNYRVRIRFKPE